MYFTFENIHHGCMRTCLDALQALTSLSAEPDILELELNEAEPRQIGRTAERG